MKAKKFFLLMSLLALGCSQTPKAEVVSTKLAPFKNPDGDVFQEVLVTWKNAGDTPIRVVEAEIKSLDKQARIIDTIIDTIIYTIFAEFDSSPGVLSGETHVPKPGQGFKLPGAAGMHGATPAASVEVNITKVLTNSGM